MFAWLFLCLRLCGPVAPAPKPVETLKNPGPAAATAQFQNVDQKTNQLMSILSTVIKTQKESSGSIVRNIL